MLLKVFPSRYDAGIRFVGVIDPDPDPATIYQVGQEGLYQALILYRR